MRCTQACIAPTPSRAHCGVCHRTFGGVKGFDEHRVGGQCLDPKTRGMTEVAGVWHRDAGKPQPDSWVEKENT